MKQLLFASAALLLIWVSVSTAYNCDPECQHGDCNAYLGNLTCECYGNWSGRACDQFICETSDPSPCLNGGICAVNPLIQSEYMCSCPFGFTGNRCQHKVPGKTSPCNTNPCGGNGTCYESPELLAGYYCDCHDGSYGPSCNFTNNACEGQSCMDRGFCTVVADNNGESFGNCTCTPPWHSPGSQLMCNTIDGFDYCHEDVRSSFCVNGECAVFGSPVQFSCTCYPGWSGPHCDEAFNVCAEPDRCYNGGTCTPDGHYFNCSCPENYAGDRCQYQIDPCYSKPCYNEGRCQTEASRLQNGYFDAQNGPVEASCDCVCGYSGEQCTGKDPVTVCTVNPCARGECKVNGSESGFSCECPPGYSGDLCDRVDHCARRPCRTDTTLECLSYNDTFVCLCADGWGGKTCEADIDECMANPCSRGNCTNEFGGYTCSCDPGWTGLNCDVAVTCADVECVRGQCVMLEGGVALCECDSGYEGDRCEIEQCPDNNCAQLAGNGRCDEACFRQSCGFDGGDCFAYPANVNPWENCTSEALCRSVFHDGRCDVQCNTRGCLYDGLDCVPSSECPQSARCEAGVENGVCDPDCNTEQCPYDAVDCGNEKNLARDTLVLIILTNADQPFETPWREQFISDLAELTNTLPVVEDVKLLSHDQLEKLQRPLVVFPSGELTRDILIYEVSFKLDLRYCSSLCPDSAEDAADWIQGAIDNGDTTIGPYGVADAFTVADTPDNPTPNLNWLWGVLAVVAIALIFVVALVMVIRKRQRSYDTTDDSEVRRVKAKIWRPESPAGSDAGTSRSTPPTDKRRSGNKAGSVLSSKDVTPAPSEEPDKYIADGSKKARMDPQNGPSHIKWAVASVAIGDKTSAVIAQDGNDDREWKKSHLDALHNPHGLKKLVMDYRVQNGSSRDVNAQGPGGFTPLMLVVMKRQPSHDAVVFPPPRDSSDSGGSDYNDHSALLPAHLTGTKLMGRPTSNSSGFSHDTGYGSQFSPVDSSVTALIEAKVDLDVANDYGQTALYLACACSRGDYVEQLLEAGANPNAQDNWGQSALQAAIDAAAEGAFMLLVNHPRTDLSLKSDGGITPLIAAVKVVNQFMVKQLLKKNVDIGSTDKEGRTAVHWAAMVDNLEALKLLIRQGPDAIKDAQDSKGQTALFLACREGSAGCVKHLLDCFANATLMDSLEQSPMHIAYQKQHMDIVEMLRSTTQGPFPMHSQAPPMRGPGGAFTMPPQYPDELGSQYAHQLVHPKKSKVKRQGSHARNGSVDSMGPGHTPTYISNVHSEGPAFGFSGMHPSGERHQTFGDLSMAPRSQQSSIQMRNYTQTSYVPPTSNVPPTHLPITSEYSKTSPVSHQNGYLPPITPPDSATLKIQPTTYSSNSLVDPAIAVSSTSGIEDMQAVALITSMADNPPVTSAERFSHFPDSKKTAVYPETSIGGGMRLQHYPLADHKQSYQSIQHNYPSPPQANSGGGSPSSAYPSPPDSNEIQQQTFQGYQYPHSSHTCSPPSLTPSPESREEALARQQFHHEIYVDTEHHGMGHSLPHHQYMAYPPLESSV